MADISNTKAVYHWIAIDVARYWNAVLIETATGQRHRFKMSNTAQDLERLITFIRNLGGRARAGLEPTGDYHRALAHRLVQAGVEVVSISSVAQSRYREAMFNSWDKNDPKNAGIILEMLKQGRTQQYADPCLQAIMICKNSPRRITRSRGREPGFSTRSSTPYSSVLPGDA